VPVQPGSTSLGYGGGIAETNWIRARLDECTYMSAVSVKILVASCERVELQTYVRQLRNSGFSSVHVASSLQDVKAETVKKNFSLIFIDERCGKDDVAVFDLVSGLRALQQYTRYVILTSDPTIEKFYLGAISGVFDYLSVTSSLHLGHETSRIMSRNSLLLSRCWNPEKIGELGFFRTLGLTKREIEILIEYLRDFPRQNELSSRIEKSPPQLRKVFSNIYTKLSDSLAIDNPAQLACLLTIGTFYRTTSRFDA